MQAIGGEIKIVVAITLLLLLITAFVILFLFFYQKRYYQHKKEKAHLQSQFAQTLLQSQVEIQEQTLQHIGRELHDNLGQIASLIKINLNTLQLNNHDSAVEKIESTKELTRQLIADIKSLSVSLGSDRITETGLDKAIEIEVDRINKTGLFTATYTPQGTIAGINKDKAVILYRMAQEVLNNMVKHSKASQIDISLYTNDNLFILAFRDNGIGFNVEEKMNASGAGLKNLKTRALLINAQLRIQSSIGAGTQVTIELPS